MNLLLTRNTTDCFLGYTIYTRLAAASINVHLSSPSSPAESYCPTSSTSSSSLAA